MLGDNREGESPVGKGARGALFTPIHGDREVNVYPIQEHELKTIGICNSQVTLWLSILSAAIALGAACIWDMANSAAGPTRMGLCFFVATILVAIGSLTVAVYYWKEKNTQIAAIKAETKTVRRTL